MLEYPVTTAGNAQLFRYAKTPIAFYQESGIRLSAALEPIEKWPTPGPAHKQVRLRIGRVPSYASNLNSYCQSTYADIPRIACAGESVGREFPAL